VVNRSGRSDERESIVETEKSDPGWLAKHRPDWLDSSGEGDAEATVRVRVSFKTALLVAVVFDLFHVSTNEIIEPVVRHIVGLL